MNMDVLDLFRGAGGWSVACQRLDITDHGVEIMPQANATAELAGHKTAWEDVWAPEAHAPRGGLIASPPCQTFSQAGKGGGRKALDDVLRAVREGDWVTIDRLRSLAERVGDERTALVLTPLYYWGWLNPEWVAFEQVPAVLPVWEACAEVMRHFGYSAWTGALQAEQYGVPQTRKRAFLIASRTREVGAPTPTHSRYYARLPEKLDEGVKRWVSMAEALGWAPASHQARNSGPGAARKPRSIHEPSYTIRAQGSGSHPSGVEWVLRNNSSANAAERTPEQPAPTLYFGQRSNYCAWEWRGEGEAPDLPDWAFNRPSTTIVGSFKPEVVAAPGYRTTVSRQNAPDSVRVTVQEAGVLQSFPADYPWQGAKGKQYLQVGNAVPPLLAEAVIREAAGL